MTPSSTKRVTATLSPSSISRGRSTSAGTWKVSGGGGLGISRGASPGRIAPGLAASGKSTAATSELSLTSMAAASAGRAGPGRALGAAEDCTGIAVDCGAAAGASKAGRMAPGRTATALSAGSRVAADSSVAGASKPVMQSARRQRSASPRLESLTICIRPFNKPANALNKGPTLAPMGRRRV